MAEPHASPAAAGHAAWDREAVPPGEYERIAAALANPESPVGIDAKHTHVLILHALARIERRLEALERAMGESPARGGETGAGDRSG